MEKTIYEEVIEVMKPFLEKSREESKRQCIAKMATHLYVRFPKMHMHEAIVAAKNIYDEAGEA